VVEDHGQEEGKESKEEERVTDKKGVYTPPFFLFTTLTTNFLASGTRANFFVPI